MKMAALKKMFILYLALLAIPLAGAAEALFVFDNANFKSSYSLGDVLDSELKFSLSTSKDIEGYLTFDLVCSESSEHLPIIEKAYVSLKAGEEKGVNPLSPLRLSKSLVEEGGISGSCYLSAVLRNIKGDAYSTGTSGKFSITDEINVDIVLEKEEFYPGDKLRIGGTAIKSDGGETEGTATLIFGEDYSTEVKRGEFGFRLVLNDDIKSGSHVINISVSDEHGNNGEAIKEISIIPVLTSVNLKVNSDSFMPEDTLRIKPLLYDQADDELHEIIRIIISSPGNKEVLNKEVYSGEELDYSLEYSASPGAWRIEAATEGFEKNLEINKIFAVLENKRINAKMHLTSDGNIFNITNTGNVPYTEDIKIIFDDGDNVAEEVKKLSIGVGQSTAIKLNAPSGNYKISIESGGLKETFPGVSLTGESIKISYESGRERIALVRNVFLIFSLIIISVLLIAKYFREWSYRERSESRKKEGNLKRYISPEDDSNIFEIGGKNG